MVRLLFLLSFLMFQNLISQTSASQQALINVSEYIEKGLIFEAKEELNICNYSNLSKQDKAEFQRLKGITYLIDGNQEIAREAAKKLFRIRPDYRQHPGLDPYEYTQFLSTFQVKRNWVGQFGIAVQNTSRQNTIEYLHLIEAQPTQINASPANLEYYLGLGYHLNPFVNLYLNYTNGSSRMSEEFLDANRGNYLVEHSSQFNNLELTNNFIYERSLINWVLTFGGGIQFMNNAFNQYESTRDGQPLYSSQDVSSEINVEQPYYTLGLGIEVPMKNDKITFNLSYRGFLNEYFNIEKRFSSITSIIEYQYIPDRYVIQQMVFNIGYKKVLRYRIK